MFGELKSMMGLLANKGKIAEEMKKFQDSIGAMTEEATAGAGYVTVKANGHLAVLNVKISDEAMALNDKELLEDMIAAACNAAFNKVRERIAAESAKMSQNLGLPPGMLGNMGGLG